MANNIKILGLDPGFADTGFGLITKTDREIKLVAVGTIRTAAKLSFSKRLAEIYQEVTALLVQYQPDLVAIEKLYFATNTKTALDVGHARGVILLAVEQTGVDIVEFTPLQIKQALTSSGNASKKQVGLMVKSLLKLSAVPRPDDAADALACAITAINFTKR